MSGFPCHCAADEFFNVGNVTNYNLEAILAPSCGELALDIESVGICVNGACRCENAYVDSVCAVLDATMYDLATL